ncbi:MAG: hypothetical protein EP330_16510 [Deltaproteobacteria bacterium]|nr:MAG: hypothetical protein EP330_16510 [Deltaproteobacteria bacterium]
MRAHLLALLCLSACGGAEETWLFSLDRDAGTGCSADFSGTLQYALDVHRDGDTVTAWVDGRSSVLGGTWDKDSVSLDEAEGQSATSTISVRASVEGGELSGTWSDANPTCTQDNPLTAWRLDARRAEHWAIHHDPASGDRRGDCAVSALVEPWTAMGALYADKARTVLLVDGAALLGTLEGDTVDVTLEVREESADETIAQSTRYQLDLASQTGTALVTRTEIRAGQTFEDCVEEVPVRLAPAE